MCICLNHVIHTVYGHIKSAINVYKYEPTFTISILIIVTELFSIGVTVSKYQFVTKENDFTNSNYFPAPGSATYGVFGCQGLSKCRTMHTQLMEQSYTESVGEKQIMILEFCVHNLLDGFTIKINENISTNECTSMVLYTKEAGKTTVVSLSYTSGECQSGHYTINIVGECLI